MSVKPSVDSVLTINAVDGFLDPTSFPRQAFGLLPFPERVVPSPWKLGWHPCQPRSLQASRQRRPLCGNTNRNQHLSCVANHVTDISLLRPWRDRMNFLRTSRNGSRKPGRSAEVLSFERPGMARICDKNNANHNTNSNDMRRARNSLGTQTDCKYTRIVTHDPQLASHAHYIYLTTLPS